MKSLKENFQKANIVIIGSGIIGKFNALELSELGLQVTIVDPTQLQNSSNAALGLLMGNMYQKRRGRSWDLRKQSIELWPQWITFLQKFNYELNIEKPLIQLTTNEEKFKKLEKFVYENNDPTLLILERDSILIKNITKTFQTKNIRGIISYKDGRIDALSLLKTLDKYLEHKKVNFLEETQIMNFQEDLLFFQIEEKLKLWKIYFQIITKWTEKLFHLILQMNGLLEQQKVVLQKEQEKV